MGVPARSPSIVASAARAQGLFHVQIQRQHQHSRTEQILHARKWPPTTRAAVGSWELAARHSPSPCLTALWQSYLAALWPASQKVKNERLSTVEAGQSQLLQYHVRSARKDSGIGAFLAFFYLLLEQRDCARYSSDAASGSPQILKY